MLWLLTLFSQGLLGCRGQRRSAEGNIRLLFPARNVTALIIDLGKEQLCSFGIFLACPFNEGTACLLGTGNGDLGSCGETDRSHIHLLKMSPLVYFYQRLKVPMLFSSAALYRWSFNGTF